jgi:predicted ATPase
MKTQGNPFFVNQLLVTLYKDGHIRPVEKKDPGWNTEVHLDDEWEEGGWVCNMEAIQRANYTSNVVDLMVAALRGLPLDVQNMVGMAATISNQFELGLLARVCGLTEQQIATSLRGAVRFVFCSFLLFILQYTYFFHNIVLSITHISNHLQRWIFGTNFRRSGGLLSCR